MQTIIQQQITLRVTDSVTYVEGRLQSNVYQMLKKELGYVDDRAIWKSRKLAERIAKSGKRPAWTKKWDGVQTTVCYNKEHCKCSIKKDGVHFPTGLLYKARGLFKDFDIPVVLVNERSPRVHASGYSMGQDFEVRDYQAKIIDDACNQERGIIKMATGAGKTGTASAIIARLAATPTIFYVTSIDLLQQAYDELTRFIRKDGKPLEVGRIGGGHCDIKDVNIMTVQTAVRSLGYRFAKFDDEDDADDKTKVNEQNKKNIVDLIHSCKNMVCDEVQHWAAKTCQIIADQSTSARYRFGLSATPWRDEGDDILIDSCFGRCIADINASFLIERGYLVQPNIYFVHNSYVAEADAYQNVYKEGIVENQNRNLMISHIAQKMADAGRNTLILVKHIDHGSLLEAMIPRSFFIHGSHSAKIRQEHLDKMRAREARITISTSIFDEGVDVRPLDGLVLAGSGKSQTRALQRVGRVIRTFSDTKSGFMKKDAFVVDFHDNIKFMKAHSNKRRAIYKTEPLFVIKDWKEEK